MQDIINFIVQTVGAWGYAGIFFMMFLESSFFPFPSEVVMIPAGYLAQKGEMSFFIAFFIGVAGSLAGAIFNYYLCYFFGRNLIIKYGKYIGINEEKMQKFEAFFNKHGEVSTFTCRLIPGIRQYISLPAGLAKMNMFRFCLYTTLGAAIWVFILMVLGYYVGENEELIKEYLHIITIMLLVAVAIIIGIYFYIIKRKNASK
ncbi:DedA family protein [Campylobacter sputorum subsp. bubulus]|uniref:DedA family protein n=1 Tax=Campylobacter sputorum subsp. sputorum TaxID=32024 RepID=A0A381DLR8_9BACT|nr:DedA family protein [Campylobacter sputorum]ASM34827.1 putative membrane protein, DedA family, type II (SNARE domain) [Campylobacter sputorum aubsp. sputorum RM3237]KAB0581617.1 DedA family protein [Campylobacter sputorum subsp. sputorum]QEL05020.1 DedA family membrane protein, type II (SNARE domain) [Campylobacter sputorum subsp. sputorum]SUX10198.1 DedA family protein [Campylobacter sputorum subsp. bubulus]SUX11507.1 DedA family protein [Campylobacter sputorum subsp. sputorum]